MPDVVSIGLGGGSLIRTSEDHGEIKVSRAVKATAVAHYSNI